MINDNFKTILHKSKGRKLKSVYQQKDMRIEGLFRKLGDILISPLCKLLTRHFNLGGNREHSKTSEMKLTALM